MKAKDLKKILDNFTTDQLDLEILVRTDSGIFTVDNTLKAISDYKKDTGFMYKAILLTRSDYHKLNLNYLDIVED